jgi:hypothetical protein
MIRTLALLLFFAQDRRTLPPPGIPVPDAVRAELQAGVDQLGREIAGLKGDLVPDVAIFHKAVDWALRYDEFYADREFSAARSILKAGTERAKALAAGKAPWAEATGLVPRAYVSAIDGSIQPYGLVVPATYKPGVKHRLDFWLHGRDEKLTELKFLDQRMKSAGEFQPPDAIVCHLYGRLCNASKFAGEVDLFEALADIRRRYSIDEDRLCVRGFSMGGASAWHLGTHHAGLWAAVAPGAGFAETPVYANVARDPVKPAWYQERLWHWYNATDYAVNLANTGVVAYSGELDPQKKAADFMAAEMKKEGLDLVHVIGPKTEHKYEPEARKEVSRLVDALAARGRDAAAAKVRFTTWTLRYDTMKWVRVDGLEKHWERARVDAERDGARVRAKTENVSAVTFGGASSVDLDGQTLSGASFVRKDGRWSPGSPSGLRKRHGLQGPIDDAFMGSFLVVRPTGKPMHEKTAPWVKREMDRALSMWRSFFRGDARVKDDSQVADADLSHNLVLWGDPGSNAVLARIADRLPIRWDAAGVKAGSQAFGDAHAPVLVFPNPLNPERYVVLNSGFTFQDQTPLSNSRHVPMLPDWAVIDTASKAVPAAGFFGELWELR